MANKKADKIEWLINKGVNDDMTMQFGLVVIHKPRERGWFILSDWMRDVHFDNLIEHEIIIEVQDDDSSADDSGDDDLSCAPLNW